MARKAICAVHGSYDAQLPGCPECAREGRDTAPGGAGGDDRTRVIASPHGRDPLRDAPSSPGRQPARDTEADADVTLIAGRRRGLVEDPGDGAEGGGQRSEVSESQIPATGSNIPVTASPAVTGQKPSATEPAASHPGWTGPETAENIDLTVVSGRRCVENPGDGVTGGDGAASEADRDAASAHTPERGALGLADRQEWRAPRAGVSRRSWRRARPARRRDPGRGSSSGRNRPRGGHPRRSKWPIRAPARRRAGPAEAGTGTRRTSGVGPSRRA